MTVTTASQIEAMSSAVIQASSMNSARSQQQREHRIGASEIGMCRNYLRFMIIEAPYDEDVEDDKFAAFVGTAIGDRMEASWAELFPNSLIQAEFEATLPSGLVVPCHSDVIDVERNLLIDWKSKDGLYMVRGEEPDRTHRYQIALYVLGAIQAGLLKPGAQAFLVYLDRSARDKHPYHAVEVLVDDALFAEIDEWIADVNYAVLQGEEASRDRPYQWCEVACPFFTQCRGRETLTEGVLDDPDVTLAAKKYREAQIQGTEAEKIKKEAIESLRGKEGFIPDLDLYLSWTHVGEATVAYTRNSYSKINLRKGKPRGGAKDAE